MSAIVAGIIGGAGSIIGGMFGASSAKKAAREAAREKKRLEAKLKNLEDNRQPVINPYEGVESLTSQMSNPYANLGVATQAAEMQAEEADIALANTLDTIRATGGGAGGATALAQAALQSKKGVSASIEAQEASNEKLRAQGEQELQRQKVAEEQRVQQAEAMGKQFEFTATEQRETAAMDRIATQISGAEAREGQARADEAGAITSAIGGFAKSIGGIDF